MLLAPDRDEGEAVAARAGESLEARIVASWIAGAPAPRAVGASEKPRLAIEPFESRFDSSN